METDPEDLDLSVIEDDVSSESGSESGSEDTDYAGLFDSRDREPPSEIALYFIYMDSENAIEKVETDMESVGDSISKERLLQIVQTKRSIDGKKYRLIDILAFQLPLEYNYLETFIKGDDDTSSQLCLNSVPIFNEIVIHPALYIFHDLTALYFFFSEAVKPLKSVLRNGASNITKKVRIRGDEDSEVSYDVRKRKSLKRFLRRGNGTKKASVEETI